MSNNKNDNRKPDSEQTSIILPETLESSHIYASSGQFYKNIFLDFQSAMFLTFRHALFSARYQVMEITFCVFFGQLFSSSICLCTYLYQTTNNKQQQHTTNNKTTVSKNEIMYSCIFLLSENSSDSLLIQMSFNCYPRHFYLTFNHNSQSHLMKRSKKVKSRSLKNMK